MLDGIFAAADIEGVAVGQEGDAAGLPDDIGHDARIVGAQVGQIAQLAEMELDGGQLALERHVVQPGPAEHLFKALQNGGPQADVKIGKINLAYHRHSSEILLAVSILPYSAADVMRAARRRQYFRLFAKKEAPSGLDGASRVGRRRLI